MCCFISNVAPEWCDAARNASKLWTDRDPVHRYSGDGTQTMGDLMRNTIVFAAAALLHVTSSQADATMSPAVKAHLCELAKRDAAFTPAEIEAMDRARAECIASLPPRESGPKATTCTAEGARRVFGSFHKQANLQCTTIWKEQAQAGKCPHKTDYLADADERVAKYCAEDPQTPVAEDGANGPGSSTRF
jgi:hypothetical protein